MSMPLYIDLETIPDQREDAFEHYLSAVKPPANYKKQETIDKWMLENAETVAAEEYQKTGLNGLYGEICSISWALGDGEIKALTRGFNESDDETSLLAMFWYMLLEDIRDRTGREEEVNWPRLEWVGHNLLEFDLRFLKQRSIINDLRPKVMIPADARHGNGSVFDTMKEFAGWRGYVKQDDLVKALGIPPPNWIDEAILEVDGSKVWELYSQGEFEIIYLYNQLDVSYVRQIHKRMMYQ